nr:SLC13 family permease [Halosimplex pelagicum]
MAPAGVTVDMVVVGLVVVGAVVLFVTEWLPVDVTAIAVMVTLILLEPWTGISPSQGISGFSSPATITVLAMLILSAGISRTGLVQILGRRIAAFAGDRLDKQLLATIGVAGPASGFVNNTPVVAVLIPVVTEVANEGHTSPSKLLIPLSYASQFGGMLTLIGTSTNILASDTAARLSGQYPSLRAFGFFEFTALGVVVFLVGSAYLLTVGHRLLPERVPPAEDPVDSYGVADYLAEVDVKPGSDLVGRRPSAVAERAGNPVEVVRLVRDGEAPVNPAVDDRLEAGDTLLVRTGDEALAALAAADELAVARPADADEALATPGSEDRPVVEVVVPTTSFLVGETIRSSSFRRRYDATVLALRTRGDTVSEPLRDLTIQAGDTLLVQAPPRTLDRLGRSREFVPVREPAEPDYRTEKIPHAVAIMAGVVGFVAVPWAALGGWLAALTGVGGLAMLAGLQQDILVTALAGVVAMVLAGVLDAGELYDSVDWNVIFLLAGVIPLGIALEETGAATLLGAGVAAAAAHLPALVVLWLFYIVTGLITEVISNNASVVLMIPVAAAAATAIGAEPFSFVLAVTFAASTAFLGPVGYQTNLFVYGPGGYKFVDYVRIGAPLQLLLSAVTVGGLVLFRGI